MNKEKGIESDNQKTLKTAILNTLANGSSLVIGIIMIPIISRILSPEELGIATTFISTRNTAVIIVTVAVYAYVYRMMLELKREKEKKDYIFSLIVFCLLTVLFSYLVALPFKNFLKAVLSLDDILFNWLFVSILIFALYSIADYYCIFHNKSILVFIIVICTGSVSPFLSVVLVNLFEKNRYLGRVFALDATYAIISVILIVWLLFSGRRRFRFCYIRQTLSFTVPIVPHLLSQMILTQFDLIMVSYFSGSDKSGLYSMGHTVGFLAFTVMSHFMASWSPWVYRRLNEKNETTVYANAKLIFLSGAFLSIGLLTISTELVHLFLASSYAPCIYIIPPLVLSMFFQFCYIFFYDLEYYYKKPNWIAVSSIIAAVLNLILNYIFIPAYGYLAAGYTTMASYFVLLICSYLFVRKLNVSRIYPLGYFVKIGFLVIGYTIFSMCFLNSIFIRYVMFLCMTGAFLWFHRNLIAEKWKQVLRWRKK